MISTNKPLSAKQRVTEQHINLEGIFRSQCLSRLNSESIQITATRNRTWLYFNTVVFSSQRFKFYVAWTGD